MSAYLVNKIRALIDEKNLSVQGLEKKSGLKIHAVRNILIGKTKKPSADTLQAIANALGCSIGDLLGHTESDPSHLSWREPLKGAAENYALWKETIEFLTEAYVQDEKPIPFEEFITLLKEVYEYSEINQKGVLDKNFAKWMYSKN